MIDDSPVPRSEIELALRRLHAWVARHGDALQRLRVEVALGLRTPADAASQIAPHASEAAEPLGAARWLMRLAELRLLRSPAAFPFLRAAESAQRLDGSWRVAGAEADPDPALPAFLAGERDPIRLTAGIAAGLASSGGARPGSVEAATAWLDARWTPDLAQAGDAGGLAALFHFFAAVDSERRDEALQWCGRELEKGFRSGAIDALRVARVFVRCEATALPGARIGRFELVRALLAAQREDGGLADVRRDPATSDAEASVLGAVALIRLAALRAPVLVAV